MAPKPPYSTCLFAASGLTEPTFVGPSLLQDQTWILQYGTFYTDSLDPILSIGEFAIDYTGGNGLILQPIYGAWDVALHGVVLNGTPTEWSIPGADLRMFRLGTILPAQVPYFADHTFKVVLLPSGD